MEVEPDEIVRIITRLIGPNETMYANTFYAQNRETVGIADAQVLADMDDWLDILFDQIEPSMDNQVIEQEAQVDVVEVQGVYNPDPEINTAHVAVVRPVGFINGFYVGGAVGEEYSGVMTGAITPATNVARTRARKSISGFTETNVIQGLFDNALFTRLINFGAFWVSGPTSAGVANDWGAGTLSLRLGIFAGFTGSFTVTNVPGTMVTRKIGRGA
jgi:hypothetical protein